MPKGRRHKITTVARVCIPLSTVWAIGAYLLYRATLQETPAAALRLWAIGMALILCATILGSHLRGTRALVERLYELEDLAANEHWGCSAEEGVQAVVAALRKADTGDARLARRRIGKGDGT